MKLIFLKKIKLFLKENNEAFPISYIGSCDFVLFLLTFNFGGLNKYLINLSFLNRV